MNASLFRAYAVLLSVLALTSATAAAHTRTVHVGDRLRAGCPHDGKQSEFRVYTRDAEVEWWQIEDHGRYLIYAWRERGIRLYLDTYSLGVRNRGRRTVFIHWECETESKLGLSDRHR